MHCDVKPQNILLTADLRAKMADFGIARAAARPADPGTVEEVVWGSPAYLSPEQAAGGALTPASDVYSTGVMLFEMLAGRLPFLGKDPQTLALRHQNEPPPSLRRINPEIPPELERIVLRAMAKRPAERYRNGDQMARVLKATWRKAPRGTWNLKWKTAAWTGWPSVCPSSPSSPSAD